MNFRRWNYIFIRTYINKNFEIIRSTDIIEIYSNYERMHNMGIKFAREYKDIIQELSTEILSIDNFYSFFEMDKTDWEQLSKDEQLDCTKTLADDIFFGLGEDPEIHIGNGSIKYLSNENILELFNDNTLIKSISLI